MDMLEYASGFHMKIIGSRRSVGKIMGRDSSCEFMYDQSIHLGHAVDHRFGS